MKYAFLFAGQGAQYPGMMKDLCEMYPQSAEVFDAANAALDRDIAELCFSGTQEELNITHNTQPCILAADLAAYAALASCGAAPAAVAGFSLGEYAALTAAGVLRTEDALRIVQMRADAMQQAVPAGEGAMAAIIGANAETIEALCVEVAEGYVIAANYNCPGQTVISGDKRGIDHAVKLAREKGMRAVELPVSVPAHCKLMQPAALKLEEIFRNTVFSEPKFPVIMNVDAEPLKEAADAARMLVMQVKSPVRFEQTLYTLRDMGIETFVEIGPGKTLSAFVKRTLKGAKICRVEDQKTLTETLNMLQA